MWEILKQWLIFPSQSVWNSNIFFFIVSPGADLDARPWDFQAEECALRANIERFNSRRYDKNHSNPDFLPVDNCLQSVLGQRVDLPEDFQMNYDLWLEREVFSKPISWEELLQWGSVSPVIFTHALWWTSDESFSGGSQINASYTFCAQGWATNFEKVGCRCRL